MKRLTFIYIYIQQLAERSHAFVEVSNAKGCTGHGTLAESRPGRKCDAWDSVEKAEYGKTRALSCRWPVALQSTLICTNETAVVAKLFTSLINC